MSPVFGHGQLRLYLLALLAEGERHGYEIIRALEERFDGLYSPSAGTVYPRLSKLEEDGLVERRQEGRKAIYRITAAGRAEVASRGGDMARLESDLDRSAADLAKDLRQRVSVGTAGLRDELRASARAARASARTTPRGRDDASEATTPPSGPGGEFELLERLLDDLGQAVRRRVRRDPDEATLRGLRAALADALHAVESLPD